MYINKNIAMSDMGFIFNPGTGDSFTTNQIGMFIIDLMKQHQSEEDIIEKILENFNVDRASAEKDYTDFMMMLRSYQLIVEEND